MANETMRLSSMTIEDRERAALCPSDYIAAGVEPPNWRDDPLPSLETCRAWQTAQDTALGFKRAKIRAKEAARLTSPRAPHLT